MKKFYAIAIAMFLMTTQTVFGQSPVALPTPQVGDSVSYTITDPRTGFEISRVTNEVTGVSDDKVFLVSQFQTHAVRVIETREMNTTTLISGDGVTYRQFETNSGHYLYPLVVGNKWKVKNTYLTRSGFQVSESLNATVEGWEQVTVPVGTFAALKVTWEGFFQSKAMIGSESGTGRREITRWLVPFSEGRLVVVQEDYRETLWRNVVIGDNRQVAKATAITFASKRP